MELKNHWIFTVILLTGTTLVASGEKKRRESVEESKALVYFPALPKSIMTKDFGIRVGGSAGSGRAKDATPPTTSPKPTTTTEKLPLAQESHVASNSVTEPPGPSYLTESVYYSDQTPAPGSEEEDDIYQRERNEEEEEEEEEKNREGELGLYLQSVSSYKPHFNGNRIVLDPLMNPASMHYIPLGPNDKASPQTATITPTVSERFQISANTTTAYKPNKVPAQDSAIITTTEATRSHQITSTTPFFSEPSRTKGSISNSKPRRVHHKHTVVRPARIHKPIQKDSPNPKVKIALRPAYKPISPSPVSTKGFLPKPAPNPFAIKISKPVVQPIAPIRNGPPTTSSPPVSEAAKRVSTPSSAGFPSLVKKLGFINTLAESKGSFGERKKIGFRRKESLGRSTTKTPDTLVEQSHRGFNFGFNKATENSPRSQYESPVVTSAPEKEAPVYRTSTKSFRAPTSLYQIRVSRGRTIAAPSQPDFIQTDSNIYVPHEYDEDAIPGEPGVDYPTYSQVPDTRFECSSQSHPGLYADQNTDCQVFHICQEGGREDSFLCPNGTIFNQQYFVCDWWYNFSCETASDFYSLNALIYELPQTEDVVTRGSYA